MVPGPPEAAGPARDAAAAVEWLAAEARVPGVVWPEAAEDATAAERMVPEAIVFVFTATPGFPIRWGSRVRTYAVLPAVSPWYEKSCTTTGKRADERYCHSKR
jgi:hypothetical protein